MMQTLKNVWHWFLSVMDKLAWLPPLLLRVSLGSMFFLTGKGKLMNLDRTAGFFSSLGIPYPELNAVIAASTECFGGLLLIAGFMTRLISLPLAFVMAVAIATAKMGDVQNIWDFMALSEWTYLLVFLWFTVHGAGSVSLDAVLGKATGFGRPPRSA